MLPWLQISPFFWPLQLPKWTGFLSNAKYKNTDVCYTVFNRSAISIFARLHGLRILIHEKDGGWLGPLRKEGDWGELFKGTGVRWLLRNFTVPCMENRPCF